MTTKTSADIMTKVAAADERDANNAVAFSFLKTAAEDLGLNEQESVDLLAKWADAHKAK